MKWDASAVLVYYTEEKLNYLKIPSRAKIVQTKKKERVIVRPNPFMAREGRAKTIFIKLSSAELFLPLSKLFLNKPAR